MSAVLDPCKHCGGQAEAHRYGVPVGAKYSVSCKSCPVATDWMHGEDEPTAKARAIAAWNRRPAPQVALTDALPPMPFVLDFVPEYPDGIAENALTTDEFALYSAMSDISEERWFAGWMGGNEYDLWSACTGGDIGDYNRDTLAYIAAMSVKTGKWIVWHSDDDATLSGPRAVDLREWTATYNNAQQCIEARNQQGDAGWISVDERMPASGQRVIFGWANSLGNWRSSMGNWNARFTQEAQNIDEEACEYNEADDNHYLLEGWNEWGWELEFSAYVSDPVTHWMPVPPPAIEQREADKK